VLGRISRLAFRVRVHPGNEAGFGSTSRLGKTRRRRWLVDLARLWSRAGSLQGGRECHRSGRGVHAWRKSTPATGLENKSGHPKGLGGRTSRSRSVLAALDCRSETMIRFKLEAEPANF